MPSPPSSSWINVPIPGAQLDGKAVVLGAFGVLRGAGIKIKQSLILIGLTST
jgi:hypothetical protein